MADPMSEAESDVTSIYELDLDDDDVGYPSNSDADGSVLTDELNNPVTPTHLRQLAVIVRRGNADELRQALVLDANSLVLDANSLVFCCNSLVLDNFDDHIDKALSERYTALHHAVVGGHLSCVELLVTRGANLEPTFNGSISLPLHIACCKGFTEIAKLLLRSANSPDSVQRMLETGDIGGETPLHLAVEWDCVDIIKLLLEEGASPTQTNNLGETPIDLAKPYSEAQRLLEEAVPGYFCDQEMPPDLRELAIVVRSGNADALRNALDNLNHSIDEPVRNQYSALQVAVRCGHLSCVELLLSRGANVEIDVNGYTSLHLAARADHVDIIRLLLGAGASPTKTNNLGKTSIDLAKPESEARRILEEAARA